MSRRRTRRGQGSWQVWFGMLKAGVALGVFGAIGFYGYEVGQRLALEEVSGLRAEIARLTDVEAAQLGEIETLRGSLAEASARAAEFEAKYAQVAPTDETRDILAAVQAKLQSGLDAKRLAFVVQAADRPRRCSGEETRRFMVKTPRYDGNATWVRFADLITVTAQGDSANGGTEEWFDPDKPVTVKFTVIGGKESEATGSLPLQHSVIAKGGEYRFTITPGSRGFVEVTGDRCEYRAG